MTRNAQVDYRRKRYNETGMDRRLQEVCQSQKLEVPIQLENYSDRYSCTLHNLPSTVACRSAGICHPLGRRIPKNLSREVLGELYEQTS